MGRTRYKEARSGTSVTQETVFSGYRDDKGMKIPTKASIERNGKLVVESEVETKFLERLETGTFARP